MLESFSPNPELTFSLEYSPGVQKIIEAKARKAESEARRIFESAAVHSTPEVGTKYVNSFNTSRDPSIAGWRVTNSHPAVIFIEFGAHPGGGATFAEGYHPLTKSIETLGFYGE